MNLIEMVKFWNLEKCTRLFKSKINNRMKYLTIASCLKNEEPYMKDFIQYHRYIGVEHFVFLDRNYQPLRELLKEEWYPDVEILHFPDIPEHTHMLAWGKAIEYTRGKTKWLACIDADQALVPVHVTDVREILKEFEQFASIQLNWHTFGSSGHDRKLPGSVYERFTMRAESNWGVNNHTQFICQPDRVTTVCPCPHFVINNPGEITVNIHKQPMYGPFNIPPIHDPLWLAHYYTKSREEWNTKISKNRADIFGLRHDDTFDEYNAECNKVREDRVLELWNKSNGS